MNNTFDKIIEDFWREHVDGGFLYRGMGRHDLEEGLDPEHDPFQEIRPQLFGLIEVLEKAMSLGFKFTVYEEHSGYSFSLNDIIAWSRGDLENPGLDFTTVYDDACGYSENYMGSQLKQNFKYVTDHLPERKDDPILLQCMNEGHWSTVAAINNWITDENAAHERIVVWVQRSHPSLVNGGCLPLGTFENFQSNCMKEITEKSLPLNKESLGMIVPEHFCYRLTRPISLAEISKIETIA